MHADYGIDAPTVVKKLALIGGGLIVVALVLPFLFFALVPGLFLVAAAALMAYGSKVRKLTLREEWIDSLNLKSDEDLLDVGCGRGLLLVAAARRLSNGRAVGVDLWRSEDQSGNNPEETRKNAEAEGVFDKIELFTADFREMPFDDASFDVVVSSWAIHNVPDKDGRAQAIKEIVRVLRPGGRLMLVDIGPVGEYVRTLLDSGIKDVSRSAPNFVFVTPSWVVRATKP